MTTASIVIHKTPPKQLEKALGCLLRSPIDHVYIIDNSPNEDLGRIAKDLPKVSYHHVKNNGFGAGHNIALKESIKKGEIYHLVMNADVYWEGDVIEELIGYMESDNSAGLIAPKVFYPDGDLQYTCRMLPTPMDLFIKRFVPGKFFEKRLKRYLLAEHDHDFMLDSPYLLGSFLLFRNSTLKEVGLFDERFFMYPEDIDITRRIHEKWKTIYYPKVCIIHEHQAASRKNKKMLWIHFYNMIKYFNKWGWWKDKNRKLYNKELQRSLILLPPNKQQKGRG